MSPSEIIQADQLAEEIASRERKESFARVSVGLGFLAAAGASVAIAVTGAFEDERFAQSMPFNQGVQDAINQVDEVLAGAGTILGVASLAAIGGVKVASRTSTRMRSMDKRSSQEFTDEGRGHVGPIRRTGRRVLRAGAAGGIPTVVAAGAALGTIFAAVGNEVTDGPSRPIEAFGEMAQGESFIVQYDKAMPMLTSVISEDLTDNVKLTAANQGISATSIDLGLNSIQYGEDNFTALTLGVDSNKLTKEMRFKENRGCGTIPVVIDKAAGIPVESDIAINGTPAKVIGEVEETSAINRIGITMDQEFLQKCVNKNKEAPSHVIVLDTDTETARAILTGVNDNGESGVVISKNDYIENSRNFWRSNVKPITNNLALQATLFSVMAMSNVMGARMMRNRREIAAKLAAGESANHIRFTELLRSAKDGVVGSSLGTAVALGAAPLVNMTEYGMRIGVGMREIAVGFGVGIIGAVGGAFARIMRPHKVINPSESTRI